MTPRARLKPSAAAALAIAVLITPLAGVPAIAAPTSPPPGQEAPTETPTEAPELEAPEAVEVGETFTLTGRGFPPEQQVTITIDEDVEFEVTSDAKGEFITELTAPVDYAAGEVTITASAEGGDRAEAQIDIEVPEHEPNVTFSTTTPIRGEAITITSEGHLPGETVTAKELLPDTLAGEKREQADTNGTAVIEYPIPENAPALATLNVFDVHQELPIATEVLTIQDPEPDDNANADADADGADSDAGADAGANPGDDANADSGAGGSNGASAKADVGADGADSDAGDGGNANDSAGADAGANPGDDANADSGAGDGGNGASAKADAGADGADSDAGDGGNANDSAGADAGANPGDDANADSDAGAGNGGNGASAKADAGADGADSDAGAGDGGNANDNDNDDDRGGRGSSSDKDGTEPPEIDVDDWNNSSPSEPVEENNRPNDPFAAPDEGTPVEDEDEDRDRETTKAPTPVDDTTDETTSQAPDTQAGDRAAASGIGFGGIAAAGAGIVVLAALALLGYIIARRKKQ